MESASSTAEVDCGLIVQNSNFNFSDGGGKCGGGAVVLRERVCMYASCEFIEDFRKVHPLLTIPTVNSLNAGSPSSSLNGVLSSLSSKDALSLLKSDADIVISNELLKAFPFEQNVRISPNLEPMFCVLGRMWFPSVDKIS
ncbi:hypothetical protein Fot_39592 [Forsythia ovata]|uniref:Uncharacterized protein n=1 Tax=Forsythia ovata TaxID=205694 RepID=A0ABD1S541_9LAMI